jgi:hypothetical protein
MTDLDQGWESDWGDDDTEDRYDDEDGYREVDDWEPDPEDAEIARSYEEYYEHCDAKHGGGQCDCRPGLVERSKWAVVQRFRDWRWRRHGYSDEPPF